MISGILGSWGTREAGLGAKLRMLRLLFRKALKFECQTLSFEASGYIKKEKRRTQSSPFSYLFDQTAPSAEKKFCWGASAFGGLHR